MHRFTRHGWMASTGLARGDGGGVSGNGGVPAQPESIAATRLTALAGAEVTDWLDIDDIIAAQPWYVRLRLWWYGWLFRR